MVRPLDSAGVWIAESQSNGPELRHRVVEGHTFLRWQHVALFLRLGEVEHDPHDRNIPQMVCRGARPNPSENQLTDPSSYDPRPSTSARWLRHEANGGRKVPAGGQDVAQSYDPWSGPKEAERADSGADRSTARLSDALTSWRGSTVGQWLLLMAGPCR